MLHLVFKASSQNPLLEACLENLGPGDALILLDDAVQDARKDGPLAAKIKQRLQEGHQVMALHEHLSAQELNLEYLPEIEWISYAEFVAVIAEHRHSRSWF